jgi:predicted pyridoxine 5'-phosphate oxidase superfamily flavin-nucleotide-binding protein
MSKLYADPQRAFQDMFDTRRIADAAEQIIVHSEVADDEKAFIESRDMFYLATVDSRGFPTCSYKGGDPGFVRVVDKNTIAFPSYDGNGMFYSMGNLIGNGQVGLLFVSFEKPHRLRVQGVASVDDNDPLLEDYAEAQLIVRVAVTEIFRNCPRYVHRYKKVTASEYVPRAECDTPLAAWKRVDDMQAALPAKDQGRAAREGGILSRAEYEKYLADVAGSEP